MRINRATAASLFAVVILTLSACSGNSDKDDAITASSPDKSPAAVVVKDDSEANDGLYDKVALKCAPGFVPVELAKGTHKETNADYKFDEEIGDEFPYEKVQKSVTLTLNPPTGVTIPAAIVHTVDSDDKKLTLTLGEGGTITATLRTAGYAYLPQHYTHYPISTVTLCTTKRG